MRLIVLGTVNNNFRVFDADHNSFKDLTRREVTTLIRKGYEVENAYISGGRVSYYQGYALMKEDKIC